MKTSEVGKLRIKNFERLRLVAYKDGKLTYSVGWGHSIKSFESYLKKAPITKEKAEELFEGDIALFEFELSKMIKVPLKQNQFDAIMSLEFNVGSSMMIKSKIPLFINQGKLLEAANTFLTLDKGNPVIYLRRRIERSLLLQAD